MPHTANLSVPSGHGEEMFTWPPGVTGSVVTAAAMPAIDDEQAAANEALARPLGSAPLEVLATRARSVCICVTDATRACPDALMVPPMLRALELAGVPDGAITILVAVGTHRKSTDAEKRAKLGDVVVDRYRVVDHDAFDPDALVKVADGPEGVPFLVNRTAVEADLLIATGRVEPHQYGGFSGGGKTVAIGCAGEAIIAYTHGPAMLDRPGVRLAQIAGNPFQEAVRTVAAAAGLRFVANAVLDDEERMIAIAYGDPVAVHDHLGGIAGRLSTVAIPGQVDIAIAGVGSPKDVNLYQASRAASYLQFAPTPVVRKGGVLIVPATCPEGAGEGVGERRFEAAMTNHRPADIVRRARLHGIEPGAQRAYIMARVLEDVTVIFAGLADPAVARRMGFETATSVQDALERAVAITGIPASALLVPHALLTLPVCG